VSSASYGSYGRGQAADECAECTATSKHIQMRKYCEMDYVYLVSNRDETTSGANPATIMSYNAAVAKNYNTMRSLHVGF
jgi:hypothetical protein